jgi:hypothetical protein
MSVIKKIQVDIERYALEAYKVDYYDRLTKHLEGQVDPKWNKLPTEDRKKALALWLQYEGAKLDRDIAESKLEKIFKTLPPAETRKYTFSSLKTLEYRFQEETYPTLNTIKLTYGGKTENGRFALIRPAADAPGVGETPGPLVIVLPYWKSAGNVVDPDEQVRDIVDSWGLQERANQTGYAFLVPLMNISVYALEKVPNRRDWNQVNAGGKLAGAEWVEGLMAFLGDKYDYDTTRLYAVGIEQGGQGINTIFRSDHIALMGSIQISPIDVPTNYIKALRTLNIEGTVPNPADDGAWKTQAISDFNALKLRYDLIIGKHEQAKDLWESLSKLYTHQKQRYLLQPTQTNSAQGIINANYFRFFGGGGFGEFKYPRIEVIEDLATEGDKYKYWKTAEVTKYVFEQIARWETEFLADGAAKRKEYTDTIRFGKVIEIINEEGDVDRTEKRPGIPDVLGNPSGNFFYQWAPSNPEVRLRLKQLCFQDLYPELQEYLANLGQDLLDPVSDDFSDVRYKLAKTQLKLRALERKQKRLSGLRERSSDTTDPTLEQVEAWEKQVRDEMKILQDNENELIKKLGDQPAYNIEDPSEIITFTNDSLANKVIQGTAQEEANSQIAAPTSKPEVRTTSRVQSNITVFKDTTIVTTETETVPPVSQTSTFNIIGNPLGTQIESATYLLKEDFMDARAYEAIMPIFQQSNVPAYITIRQDIGAPGAFSQGELEEQTTQVTAADIHNPFKGGARYNQFILKGLQESHNEKYQIMDTLTEGQVIFSFDRKPEIWSLTGVLLNDIYSNWLGKFRHVWHEHLRISQLVKNGKYARFVIPSLQIAFNGYPIGLNLQHVSEQETAASFSMAVFIREVKMFETFPFDTSTAVPELAGALLGLDKIKFKAPEVNKE